MTVKGLKLKSESFFSISHGVLELWRKNLRGADSPPLPTWIGLKEQIGLKVKSENAKQALKERGISKRLASGNSKVEVSTDASRGNSEGIE